MQELHGSTREVLAVEATVKSLILTTVVRVCVLVRLFQANQWSLFPTNTLIPLPAPLAIRCLSPLILLQQQAFISALPVLTSQTAS